VESAQDDNCGEVKRSKRYISYVVDSQEVDWTSPNIHSCQAVSKSSVNSQFLRTTENY
jgi:hypothetical protein